jgi:hypothetical protein
MLNKQQILEYSLLILPNHCQEEQLLSRSISPSRNLSPNRIIAGNPLSSSISVISSHKKKKENRFLSNNEQRRGNIMETPNKHSTATTAGGGNPLSLIMRNVFASPRNVSPSFY